MHRRHHFRRWVDALDLDADHLDAPLVGGVVEHLAELGVDRVAGRERTVELEVADQVAQVGLGELRDRREEVGDVVDEPLRVGGLVVHDGVDRHDHVVGGDDLLRRHVDHLLAHVDQLHRLDERHDQPQARLLGGLVLAEPLDEAALVRADDLHARRQHGDDHDHDGDHDDDVTPSGHSSSARCRRVVGRVCGRFDDDAGALHGQHRHPGTRRRSRRHRRRARPTPRRDSVTRPLRSVSSGSIAVVTMPVSPSSRSAPTPGVGTVSSVNALRPSEHHGEQRRAAEHEHRPLHLDRHVVEREDRGDERRDRPRQDDERAADEDQLDEGEDRPRCRATPTARRRGRSRSRARRHLRRVRELSRPWAGRGCRARRAACGRPAVGALVIGSAPLWVFGKAITSRMFSSPARIATRRSMPNANPPCGGAPYWNGLRKKPNLRSASSALMPSSSKMLRLQLGLVDPDRTRTELPAVEHEVVGLAAHRHRVGVEQVDVVGVRLRERVVARLRAAARLVDADEHREVDDPQVAVRPLVHRRAAEVVAQLAEHLARGDPLVGDDQQQVARLGREALRRRAACSVSDRNLATGDSSAPSAATFIHTRPLAPICLAVSVSPSSLLRPYSSALPGGVDALDAGGAGERLELGGGEHVGQLGELHAEAQVGLVDAEALHRLVPGDLDDLAGVLADGLGGGEHGVADRGRARRPGRRSSSRRRAA